MDEQHHIQEVYENRNISNFVFVDGSWIYALQNNAEGYDNSNGKSDGNIQPAGFYIYDVARLAEGNIETHFLSTALAGALDFIDFDFITQTISFVKDFSTVVMMPLAHRNTLKFQSMHNKKNYLVWRQHGGIFTAVDKRYNITMWSTVTGKILSQIDSKKNETDATEEKKNVEEERKSAKSLLNKSIIGKLVKTRQIDKVLNIQSDQLYESATQHGIRKFQVYQANSKD